MEQHRGEMEQADQSMVEVENREKPKVMIINMTGHEMSQGDLNLCRKDLGFTPVPRDNVPELKADISIFNRRLRLAEFFKDTEPHGDGSIVRNKGKFTPKRNIDLHLDHFIDHLNRYPINTTKNVRDNLSKSEREAIKTIIHNDDLIIKEADKGSAVCIMNKNFYEQNMLECSI